MTTTTHIYSFESLPDAQQARDALLAAGFDPARVRLRSVADEAGPVEGDFVIGNGRPVRRTKPPGALAGREGPYGCNFERQVYRGTQLLEVDGSDEDAQKARAVALAHRGTDAAQPNGGR